MIAATLRPLELLRGDGSRMVARIAARARRLRGNLPGLVSGSQPAGFILAHRPRAITLILGPSPNLGSRHRSRSCSGLRSPSKLYHQGSSSPSTKCNRRRGEADRMRTESCPPPYVGGYNSCREMPVRGFGFEQLFAGQRNPRLHGGFQSSHFLRRSTRPVRFCCCCV